MSSDEEGTVADRIADLMRSLPPREGRKSRLGHVSIEDFAVLLGTGKQRVIEWLAGSAYPDPRNRDKLAAVSSGRYSPDDFKGPSTEEKASMLARLKSLSVTVDELEVTLAGLLSRVEALEHAAEGRQRGRGES